MKTYKEWYWGLYRWFKWKFPHFHKTLYQGIKNLIKWGPIIYQDRDWDYSFTFKILKFKLENTKEIFKKHNRFESGERNVELMGVCIKLIDRIMEDFYHDEYFSYYKSEMLKEPNENGSYSINFKTTEDRTDEFINMYPHSKRVLFNNPKWESFRHNPTGRCLAIGQIRHDKAKKLLFRILEEKIEHWWM
jgi:hypothetical protein